MAVNVSVYVFYAQNALTQLFPARLDLIHKGLILSKTFPHGRGGVGLAALVDPGIDLIGIAEIAVSVSQVIVPHCSSMQLAAGAVRVLFLLVEICAALESVGIQAQLGMDKVIHKRLNAYILGVTLVGIGKIIALDNLLDGLYVIAYVFLLLLGNLI